ncbi:hypothetical protein [Propioniciclava flava]
MSASDPIQPYPTEPGSTPPAPPAPTKRPRNTIALVALIVAILGFAFAVIEGAYLLGWVLLPIGFVLGLVGLFARDRGKGLAVAAVIVSVVGTIAGVVAFTSSMSRVVNESFRPGTTTVVPSPGATTTEAPAGSPATTASGKRTIELKVTSERQASVSYAVGSGSSSEETSGSWSKTLQTDRGFEFVSLSAMNAEYSKKNAITCEILVDGVSVSQQSGSGTSAMASCSATVS